MPMAALAWWCLVRLNKTIIFAIVMSTAPAPAPVLPRLKRDAPPKKRARTVTVRGRGAHQPAAAVVSEPSDDGAGADADARGRATTQDYVALCAVRDMTRALTARQTSKLVARLVTGSTDGTLRVAAVLLRCRAPGCTATLGHDADAYHGDPVKELPAWLARKCAYCARHYCGAHYAREVAPACSVDGCASSAARTCARCAEAAESRQCAECGELRCSDCVLSETPCGGVGDQRGCAP